MKLLDSRRLRGPSLDCDRPAAIAEVALERGETPERAVAAWRAALARMAQEIRRGSLADGALARSWPGGAALLVPAPIDVLLAAADLNEWAVEAATRTLSGGRPLGVSASGRRLARRFRHEARPRLVALERAAREHGVPFLWDDDVVTLGHAARSRSFPMESLPRPDDVEWSALGRVPVALVTGTNGKTTTTRLLARMAKLAGLVPGHTSSDGVAVDEQIVEAGDWTGAEAARLCLRRPEVEIAILETARGGILRRGLAIERADAAILTNVSADHMGEHGVTDLREMARVKAVCARAVPRGGKVVLNASDPELVRLAPTLAAQVVLFARDPSAPLLAQHLAVGGHAFVADGGALVHVGPEGRDSLARIDEVPLTFGGVARYNVENALGAAALGWSLDLPRAAIVEALRTFGLAPSDNPGRGAVVVLEGGVRALLDFGHNPAGYRELLGLARSLAGAGALTVVTTHAGDRDDADFADFARAIVEGGAARVVIWETEHLLRGRAAGEPRALLRRELARSGLSAAQILDAATEADAIGAACERAAPGDLVVVAPHLDRGDLATLFRGRLCA